jgi:hypothetical protein
VALALAAKVVRSPGSSMSKAMRGLRQIVQATCRRSAVLA